MFKRFEEKTSQVTMCRSSAVDSVLNRFPAAIMLDAEEHKANEVGLVLREHELDFLRSMLSGIIESKEDEKGRFWLERLRGR